MQLENVGVGVGVVDLLGFGPFCKRDPENQGTHLTLGGGRSHELRGGAGFKPGHLSWGPVSPKPCSVLGCPVAGPSLASGPCVASGSARSRLRLPPPFCVTLGKCLNLSGLQGMIPPLRLRDEEMDRTVLKAGALEVIPVTFPLLEAEMGERQGWGTGGGARELRLALGSLDPSVPLPKGIFFKGDCQET